MFHFNPVQAFTILVSRDVGLSHALLCIMCLSQRAINLLNNGYLNVINVIQGGERLLLDPRVHCVQHKRLAWRFTRRPLPLLPPWSWPWCPFKSFPET